MRKGYIYTIEGIISALLLLVFLSAIFQPPGGTNWDTLNTQKQARELVHAMDQAMLLDELVARNDPQSLDALLQVIGSNMDYDIRISGFPERSITIGVAVEENDIISEVHGNQTQTKFAAGLPEGDGGFGIYRNSTVFDVPFVVADVTDDGVLQFSQVVFDFDGDGDYDRSFEGPFELSGVFLCQDLSTNTPDTDCDRDNWEVGNINVSHLILYDATRIEEFENRIADTTLNGVPISFTFDGVSFNPVHEPFSRVREKDMIFFDGWTATEIQSIEDAEILFEILLQNDKAIIFDADLSEPQLQDGSIFHDIFNLSYEDRFGITCPGICSGESVFAAQDDFATEAAHLREYFFTQPLRNEHVAPDVENGNGELERLGWDISAINQTNGDSTSDVYYTTTTRIRGQLYYTLMIDTDNDDATYERVYFSTDIVFDNSDKPTEEDERVRLGTAPGESFFVQRVVPLELEHTNEAYTFRDLYQNKVRATDMLLKQEGYVYNVSAYDIDDINVTANDVIPPGAPSGENVCNDGTAENTSLQLRDNTPTFSVWVTNFSTRGPAFCSTGFDLVNFDFNGNDVYDDAGNSSYSAEGPWQHEDIVVINNSRYRIDLLNHTVGLERVADERVGVVWLSNDPYRDSGRVVWFRNIGIGDDEFVLLKSIFMRLSREERAFNVEKSLPEESVGVNFMTQSSEQIFIPIEGVSTWWQR